MQRLNVRLLGKPELSFDGKVLRWKAPPKAYPLLAMLALDHGKGLPRRQLAVSLWPDDLESDGLTKLRRHLYHLNRMLPSIEKVEWIAQTRDLILWNDDAPAWFDVRAFRDALDAGRIREAVELYRGDLLDESYDEIVLQQREPLRAAYLEALLLATREVRESRDYALATAYAEKLLTIDEWNEEGVREWMSAKYESGDRSAALAMYERFAKRLKDEFSVAPTAQTSALRETIRAGLHLSVSPVEALRSPTPTAQRGWTFPFVGRAQELQTLGAAWSRAARGNGTLVFLSGEAGIGKSRLAAELAGVVESQGGAVLVGRTSIPEAEPYQAILAAIRNALPLLSRLEGTDAWLGVLARVLPELHALRSDLVEEELPPAGARKRLFEAIVRAFEQVCRVRPLYVVLEDLHDAGPATIELLEALGRRIGALPILVLVTYRSEETATASPLRLLRAALTGEHRAIAQPLSRLTPGTIAHLVSSQVAQDDALSDAVARLSEGNPLFASQLLAGYMENHVVPDATAAVHDICEAIAIRADRLAAQTRTVAEIAAVLGGTFRADMIADTGGMSEDAVLDALGELMDRGLVREAGGSLQYAFSHALIASTLYAQCAPTKRAARHRRVADLLERERGGGAASAVSIARHWKAAGEPQRACRAYLRAADLAGRLYARADAIAFAREALALAADDQQRADAAFTVAYTEATYSRYIGDRERQRVAIDTMMKMTADGASAERRGIALHALGSFYHLTSQLDLALAPLQEALAIAIAHDRNEDALDIRFRMSHAHSTLARYEEAEREIAAMESSPAAFSTYARTLIARARIALASSRQDTAMADASAHELLDISRATDDLEGQVQARTALGWVMQCNDTDAATIRRNYEEAIDAAQRLKFLQGNVAASIDLGQFESRIGNYDAAIEIFDRVIASLPSDKPEVFLGFCIANRARALCARGDVAEAHETALQAWNVAQALRIPRLSAAAGTVLGMTSFHTGERESALEHLCAAVQLRRDIGNVPGLADALYQYGEALLACDRIDEGRPVLEELATLSVAPTKGLESDVAICNLLARSAERRGDAAAAAAHRKRGETIVARQLRLLPDEGDRQRYLRRFDALWTPSRPVANP